MKETKVYVDELPESCSKCPCTHEDFAECNWCQVFDNGLLTFIPDEIYSKERLKNCPLQSLKQHDQELVKEVCEKIKNKLGSIEDILINLGNGKEDALNYFMYILNKTQKEYEK